MERTLIVAHRGDSERYPENTIAAFEQAIKKGADTIEFDVHMSADGRLVVHHDYYLGTTDNGEGCIFEKDWDYLKKLDVGSWYDPKFSGCRMPSFSEVLSLVAGKIRLEIELKGFGKQFLQAVKGSYSSFDRSILESIEFTASGLHTLNGIRSIMPGTTIGIFLPEPPSWMKPQLAQKLAEDSLISGNVDVGHFPLSVLSEEFVGHIQRQGKIVHAANCDNKEDLQKAFQYGVNQLSTNRLELAVEVRASGLKKVAEKYHIP